ncbi:MAG TPA: M28 family peptidase [Desulfuromonadaceae bacterium]|jgi:hypothetical protein
MPTSKRAGDVSIDSLQEHVTRVAGLRHGRENYEELEKRGEYIQNHLISCGLPVMNQYLQFKGRKYRNIIATVEGSRPELPALLVGAHYDGNRQTPGADDNASGVAVLLETAAYLIGLTPCCRIDLVAFTLEEPQTFTHIIRRGSRFFAKQARERKVKYDGAVILECVGFTAEQQQGASLSRLFGMGMPDRGEFLAVVANRKSKTLMKLFLETAARNVPLLKTAGYATPAQGYLLPQLRFSDHSSFWEQGYQAIMLNDTVMFRNGNYHKPTDTPDTLDYVFMAKVATAVAAFAAEYALTDRQSLH